MKQLIVAFLLASTTAVSAAGQVYLVNVLKTGSDVCEGGWLYGYYIIRPPTSGPALVQSAVNCDVHKDSRLRYTPSGHRAEAEGGAGGTLGLNFRNSTFAEGSSLRFMHSDSNSVPMVITVEECTFASNARLDFDASFELPNGASVTLLRNTFAGHKAGQVFVSPMGFAPVIMDDVTVSITANTISCLGYRRSYDDEATVSPVGINVVPAQIGRNLDLGVRDNRVNYCTVQGDPLPTAIVVSGLVTGAYSVGNNHVYSRESSASATSGIVVTGVFRSNLTGLARTPALSISRNTFRGNLAAGGSALLVVGIGESPVIDLADNDVFTLHSPPSFRVNVVDSTGPVFVRMLRNALECRAGVPRLILQLPHLPRNSVVLIQSNRLRYVEDGALLEPRDDDSDAVSPRAAVGPYIVFETAFTSDAGSVVDIAQNTAYTAPRGTRQNKLVGWSLMPITGTVKGPLYFCDNILDGKWLTTAELVIAASVNLPTTPRLECPEVAFPVRMDYSETTAAADANATTAAATVEPEILTSVPRSTVLTGAAPKAHPTAAALTLSAVTGLISTMMLGLLA